MGLFWKELTVLRTVEEKEAVVQKLAAAGIACRTRVIDRGATTAYGAGRRTSFGATGSPGANPLSYALLVHKKNLAQAEAIWRKQ